MNTGPHSLSVHDLARLAKPSPLLASPPQTRCNLSVRHLLANLVGTEIDLEAPEQLTAHVRDVSANAGEYHGLRAHLGRLQEKLIIRKN